MLFLSKIKTTSLVQEYFDEEGLIKQMELSELTLKISKLSYSWEDRVEPFKEAHYLINQVQRISLEISEFQERMETRLSDYQRNLIYNALEDLEKLIPYLKRKIKSVEGIENPS